MRLDTENVDKVLIENDLVVMHKIDRIHFMDKPHFHDGFEIHFTLTNSTTYQIDERKFDADAGTVALFSSEELHRVSIDRSKLYERYFVLFKPSFIEEFTTSFPFLLEIFSKKQKVDCLELTSDQSLKVTNLYEEMIRCDQEREEPFELLHLKLKLTELLILLNKIVYSNEKLHKPISYEHYQTISEIVSFLKEEYMNEMTLDELSERFFISKSTIIRAFKNALGMTPNQYLIYMRIMKSRELLEQGYSVKQVSEKIGYRDESSYIKKFKEIQAESPKQYQLKNLRAKRS